MRNEWREVRIAILTQILLSTIAALLSHLGLGCSTGGHWGPHNPQSASWFSRWHPVSKWLEPPGHLVILYSNIHLLLLFFRLFTQVHLLIDGTVKGQYITHIVVCFCQKMFTNVQKMGLSLRAGVETGIWEYWLRLSRPNNRQDLAQTVFYKVGGSGMVLPGLGSARWPCWTWTHLLKLNLTWVQHVCLLIAYQCCLINAVRPAEGSPTEGGGHSASNWLGPPLGKNARRGVIKPTGEYWWWRDTPHYRKMQSWNPSVRCCLGHSFGERTLPICSRCILQAQPSGSWRVRS